jgi:hypothetical protein
MCVRSQRFALHQSVLFVRGTRISRSIDIGQRGVRAPDDVFIGPWKRSGTLTFAKLPTAWCMRAQKKVAESVFLQVPAGWKSHSIYLVTGLADDVENFVILICCAPAECLCVSRS